MLVHRLEKVLGEDPIQVPAVNGAIDCPGIDCGFLVLDVRLHIRDHEPPEQLVRFEVEEVQELVV